jgi:hypothetical protein
MDLDGVTWTLDCSESSRDAFFALQLKIAKLGLTFRGLSLSLGNNKVRFSESMGPIELGGSAPYFMYSVRAASVFTGQPAGRVNVIEVRNYREYIRTTESSGWVTMYYYPDQTGSFKTRNPYDGS